MYTSTNIQIGDIVSVAKGPFTHVGVVVPDGVLQNSPGSYERIVPWHEFVDGQQVTVRHTGVGYALLLQRVQAILAAPKRYHVMLQNCEHTVNAAVYGERESPQVALVITGLLAMFTLVAAFSR